ncbi:MAG: sialate O-acetylesterase [Anaerolineae bacterium]|nr:sialate O-acetylesterase [Anaerolineae bacterium]
MTTALLILSLVLNVLFATFVIAFWLQRVKIFHRVIHEIDARAAMTFFDTYSVAPADMVFLGDSITAGGHWTEMFPGLSVRNRGISGDRTVDVLKRLDQVTAGKPAKLFLMIGTNDIGLGVPGEETVRNYAAILDKLTQASPQTRIYVQSVLPREPKAYDDVLALNAVISEMAQARGLPYLDFLPAFVGEDGGIRPSLSYDRLHLSGEGYRLWQSLLEPYATDLSE